MISGRPTLAPAVVLAVTLVAVSACTSSDRASAPVESSGPVATPPDGDGDGDGDDPGTACVVAAAGDVAGEEDLDDGAERTAELIAAAEPRKVLALGDLAYPDGTAAEYADLYDPTWGEFRDITAPTPGNHEYRSERKGYDDYFDVEPNYAFDVCGWHLVSVDHYAGVSEAAAFIEEEGEAAGDAPLLVYWHAPRFSSGHHGTDPELQPLWEAAVEAGAEVVLNAHDHHYERFEPLDEDGEPRAGGTVQFVSGNGGHNLRKLDEDRESHSAVALAGTPGVLFLTLRADGYDWSYRDVEGRTGDAGTRERR
ncbi:metallophosphoesterase family protein [Modestobacter marinus]|uniref:metallophosphoesterase family protein n=1 Tax=Modestobacter marinus TaxID=477641 RepID=UPI001C94BC44|nr:metallophosphoesterase [Modestobacter marinus]